MKLAAVVGARQSGKTTTLRELAEALSASGLVVGGVVQIAALEAGQPVAYELEDVATGARRQLARRRSGAAPRGLGFEFDEDAWGWAADVLRRAREHCDVVVVDELGRLEATGAGHLPALRTPVIREKAHLWLLGVRADAASAIESRLGSFDLVLAPRSEREASVALLRRLAAAAPSAEGR
jgi:nucleoside-triphosphatase THEP1